MFDLHGKKGLIVGVANRDSIAWGCARQTRAAGARLALTYLNDKAREHVAPLAAEVDAELLEPLNVECPGQADELFEAVAREWGSLDFLIHAIAFAPAADLHGRVTDCSEAGFARAMRVSCYSLIELARRAEPLMSEGGTIVTMSFGGAERVVDNYGMMGPVKAALECTARYLAAELGPRGIRVHSLSPGPVATRAASGLPRFDALLDDARQHSPLGRLVDISEIGATAAFLVGNGAAGMSGQTIYVDGGRHAVC
jgi:enoyl-[acyl-carrier protein] reductase I